MRTPIMAIVLPAVLCGTALGQSYLPSVDKFKVCETEGGDDFAWVDSTTGSVWRADPKERRWVFFGRPEGADPGPPGTYVAHKPEKGRGLYVLNTATGEGWWTDGTEWKKLEGGLQK